MGSGSNALLYGDLFPLEGLMRHSPIERPEQAEDPCSIQSRDTQRLYHTDRLREQQEQAHERHEHELTAPTIATSTLPALRSSGVNAAGRLKNVGMPSLGPAAMYRLRL